MKISIRSFKNTKLYNWAENLVNTNGFAKAVILHGIWAIALIPTYLYLLVRWGIGPDGFWEELALAVLAILVIGWLQGLLIFFGIVLTLVILFENV